jgi:hypothetical protein
MTPEEFATKWEANTDLTVRRKEFAKMTFQYPVNGKTATTVLGLVSDLALADSFAAAFPTNYVVERVFYAEIEDPAEAAPRVPVYVELVAMKGAPLTIVATIDKSITATLAKVTTQETVDIVSAFFPELTVPN